MHFCGLGIESDDGVIEPGLKARPCFERRTDIGRDGIDIARGRVLIGRRPNRGRAGAVLGKSFAGGQHNRRPGAKKSGHAQAGANCGAQFRRNRRQFGECHGLNGGVGAEPLTRGARRMRFGAEIVFSLMPGCAIARRRPILSAKAIAALGGRFPPNLKKKPLFYMTNAHGKEKNAEIGQKNGRKRRADGRKNMFLSILGRVYRKRGGGRARRMGVGGAAIGRACSEAGKWGVVRSIYL